MLRKIIIASLFFVSGFVHSGEEWTNTFFAEKHFFSYSAQVYSGVNKIEYQCAVLKINNSDFGKIDFLNLDVDLKLDDDKLNFQEYYNVSLRFSNGATFDKKLELKSEIEELDRFKIFFEDYDKSRDEIISNLMMRKYVDLEISDDYKKRMLYRFYLDGSKKSINKTKIDCDLLYRTFK